MKDGSRGWMQVKELRSQLIEVDGSFLVTMLNDHEAAIYSADRKKELGRIDLIEEKVKMKETV